MRPAGLTSPQGKPGIDAVACKDSSHATGSDWRAQTRRPVRPYHQASPSPARHRPGARSARREGRRYHYIADHLFKGEIYVVPLDVQLREMPVLTHFGPSAQGPPAPTFHSPAL